MNSGFTFLNTGVEATEVKMSGVRVRTHFAVILVTLGLMGCGPSSSDDSLDVKGAAGDDTRKAEDTSTGFVSNASMKAAQQAVDTLEKQKLLQNSQASDAAGRSSQSP